MKSCGNCANCFKATNGLWICEEYGYYANGVAPVHCEPPYDEPCEFWTDDPKMANTWLKDSDNQRRGNKNQEIDENDSTDTDGSGPYIIDRRTMNDNSNMDHSNMRSDKGGTKFSADRDDQA